MTSRMMSIVALILALTLAACSPATRTPGSPGQSPWIRALVAERSAVDIGVSSGFEVETGGMVLMRSERAGTVNVSAVGGDNLEIRLAPGGDVGSAQGDIAIVPRPGGELRVSDTRYDGRMTVRTGSNGKLMVINVLPLEAYLEGVVPHEIGNPGPDAYAAVQAQAITARTYALGRIDERRGEDFDVFAGVRDQVYRGKERVFRATSAAVRDTRGVVLTLNGKLSRTYYSATCGGHTSDIRRAWPHRDDAPYLHGSYDRSGDERQAFCHWVRNFRWRYSFTGKELGRVLRKTIPVELGVPADDVGSFVDLRVVERNPSGRVRRVEIVTTTKTFAVEADRIRWVLMADVDRGRILPSTMFKVERAMRDGRAAFVSIAGGGNGHGVGMCQNGAIGMARRGYSHHMILSHYYPGTSLSRRY